MHNHQVQDFYDASTQQRGLDGWNQIYTQLGRGVFRGSVARLDLGSLSLVEERLNVVVEQETDPPPGKLVLIFPTPTARRINGAHYANQGFVHFGGNDIRLVTEGESRSFTILLDQSDFPGQGLRRLAPISAITNHAALGVMADWIASLLAAAPDLVRYASRDIAVLSSIVHDKVIDVCSAMLLGEVRTIRSSAAVQLVDRARRLTDGLPSEQLTAGQLARELGVPGNVLRDAFVQCTGISTHFWLRYHRLARARRQLLVASDTGGGVTEIAMENGFFHLGRFAGFYAQIFGETPAATLRGS